VGAESDVETEDRAHLESSVEARLGRRATSIESIMAGLGTRRFYRLRFAAGDPATLIARFEADDSGAPVPGPDFWRAEPALEPLRGFLEAAGLPVPHSYAHLPEEGLDLLEDAGDQTLLDASASERERLYRVACDLVPRLQRLRAPADRIPAFGRIFDRALVSTKAWKWIHWTIPGLLGRDADPDEAKMMTIAFDRLASALDDAPRRLSHRDFKAENLHLAQDTSGGPRRLVMIDVQGAFLAPPEYDLVCLLYDLQVDLAEDFVERCLRETLPRLPDRPDEATAAVRFDALATLRLCKDISHLVHAARWRGDSRRWHELPRGLTLLDRAAGRLAHTFPEIRALTSVIPALSAAIGSSDIPSGRRGRE
jgi:aminoglycoside/choline kinase family phosphotransferase